MTDPGGTRYFDAVVDVVDDDEPAFAAWLAVSDHTLEIHAFDITLGSWQAADVSAVSSDEGVLIEVPGSMLVVSCSSIDELLACLTEELGSNAA